MNFSFYSVTAVASAFKWLLLHGNEGAEIIPRCFYRFHLYNTIRENIAIFHAAKMFMGDFLSCLN